MEQPVLEKMVLAKLRLPADVQKEIKKYLQEPTPTARLIKKLTFRNKAASKFAELRVVGLDIRRCVNRAYWTHPPFFPGIVFRPRKISVQDMNEGDVRRSLEFTTLENGELRAKAKLERGESGRFRKRYVTLCWPSGQDDYSWWEEELEDLVNDPDLVRIYMKRRLL